MPTKFNDSGRFETAHASRYLQQLCKHFAHKVDVSFDEHQGTVKLQEDVMTLTATETALTVTIAATEASGIPRAHHVIDSHLKTFAFREGFEHMDWDAAAGPDVA